MKSTSPQQPSVPYALRPALLKKPRRRGFLGRQRLRNVLLVVAILLSLIPLSAGATTFYKYFHTGNPYNIYATPPYTTEQFVTILKITSPTLLLAGAFDQKNTPGLTF